MPAGLSFTFMAAMQPTQEFPKIDRASTWILAPPRLARPMSVSVLLVPYSPVLQEELERQFPDLNPFRQ
jgi:hypothetical protein